MEQHHYAERRAAASLSPSDWAWTKAVTLLVIQLLPVILPSCCQRQLMWCSEDNTSYTLLNDSVCNRKVEKLWKDNTKSAPYIKQAWTRAKDSLRWYQGDKTSLVQNLLEQKIGLPWASASWENIKEKPEDYCFLTSAFTTKHVLSQWIKRHIEEHFKRVKKEFRVPSCFQVCQFWLPARF